MQSGFERDCRKDVNSNMMPECCSPVVYVMAQYKRPTNTLYSNALSANELYNFLLSKS